jgi:hypothetical protein
MPNANNDVCHKSFGTYVAGRPITVSVLQLREICDECKSSRKNCVG